MQADTQILEDETFSIKTNRISGTERAGQGILTITTIWAARIDPDNSLRAIRSAGDLAGGRVLGTSILLARLVIVAERPFISWNL